MDSVAKHLLDNVASIIKSYEKVAAITGENFNIFSVLKMDTSEVKLHSALLGELLNPQGSHGQKDVFLKLFLKEIDITDFDTKDATVEVEKHIGAVTDDTGGRIDLVISSSHSNSIIIENKIYAADGYNQLLRYYNGDKKAHLFYLTLDGSEPSKESLGSLKIEQVKLISYRTHIINWLEECKKQAVEFPLLRETITQYIYLLKRLTNQSINNKMNEDIISKIFNTEETFKSAEEIAKSVEHIDELIYSECKRSLKSVWNEKYEVERDKKYDVKWGVMFFEYERFTFFIRPSYEKYRFHFQIFPLNPQTNELGVANDSEIPSEFREIARNLFDDTFSNVNYTLWGFSRFDLDKLPFIEYKKLYEDRSEWVDKVIEEGEAFMKDFINEIKTKTNHSIKISPKLIEKLNL